MLMEKVQYEYVEPLDMDTRNKQKIKLIQIGEKLHSITLLHRWTRKRVGGKRKVFQEGVCDCGLVRFFCKEHLLSGATKSCGCVKVEKLKIRSINFKKHGMEGSRFYRKYSSMRNRCINEKNDCYKRYGGRGIKCAWQDFQSFMDDMYYGYLEHCDKYGADNTTIERIDNDGNYCKENCKRSTYKEQQNNKSSNKIIDFNGSKMTLQQFCDLTGSNYGLVFDRLSRGRSINESLKPTGYYIKRSKGIISPLFITNKN